MSALGLDEHLGLVIATIVAGVFTLALSLGTRRLIRRKHPLAALVALPLTLAGLAATLVLTAVYLASVGPAMLQEYQAMTAHIKASLASIRAAQ